MTNTALIERSSSTAPSLYSHAYQVHDENVSIMDSDVYAKKVAFALAHAGDESFHQMGMHITFGQMETTLLSALGFQLGRPSISPLWTKSDALPGWIVRVLKFCDDGRDDAALKEISLSTTRFKARQEFKQLSTDLARFDLRTLPDIVLVSLLRNIYSIRSHISCWTSLLEQTERLLEERKLESRSLLRGLKSYLV